MPKSSCGTSFGCSRRAVITGTKKNGFYKRKGQSRDKTRPAYNKERTIIPRDKSRKKYEQLSHHHAVRSPQKRAKPNNFAQIEAAAEVVVPHIDVSPADAEQVAEEIHTPHHTPLVRPQRKCLKRRIIAKESMFDETLSINHLTRVSYIMSIIYIYIYIIIKPVGYHYHRFFS